jgi:hypothetical protein
MKKKLSLIAILALVACNGPWFYNSANLNVLPLELTKDAFFQRFPGQCTGNGVVRTCMSPILRAAQRSSDGSITEVITLDLMDQNKQVLQHWFVFKNGTLKQWGRPEDWQQVASRYEVTFNPNPSVRTP